MRERVPLLGIIENDRADLTVDLYGNKGLRNRESSMARPPAPLIDNVISAVDVDRVAGDELRPIKRKERDC